MSSSKYYNIKAPMIKIIKVLTANIEVNNVPIILIC
jgi:hypothetical protein